MTSPKPTRKSYFCGGNRLAGAACLLFFAPLLCHAAPPASRAGSAPDWLVAAGHVDLGHFGDGSAAVIVGEWNDFTVDASGKFVMTEREAIRVRNRRAAGPYLTAEEYENNESKVVSIQTWAIAPSGRVTQSGKDDLITVAGFSEFEMFSDDRLKMIKTPGAEDGSLVGFEIVTQGTIPINGMRFPMEMEIPVRQSELRVSVPSGSLRWFINYPDRVAVVNSSPTGATFRAENRAGIPEEPHAPPFSSLAAEVVINYDAQGPSALQSWAEAGHSYHTLFDNAETSETEIASQVGLLENGQSDTLSKIDALYNYVSRQIRYVAIEIGIGGYQPHPAEEVYKNKYGDCKDKANLLISMLGKIGLRGYPALVGTRGDVEANPKIPTLTTFDHMIVALPVSPSLRPSVERFPSYDPKTQILWIDPTSEADPLGQLPEMDQGVFALIAYPDHGDLQRIPEAPLDTNGIRYTAHVVLQTDGSGTADVEVKYLGAADARRHYFYRGRSQSEILKGFEDRVTNYVSQAQFERASISGVSDSHQQITERFSFAGDFSSASTGDTWFLQPLFLAGMSIPEYGSSPRRLPLEIGTPEQIQGKYRIELPPGMRVNRLPENISLKSEFGELEVEYSISGNAILAKQTFSFTQSRISPEKYPAFRAFMNSCASAERQSLRVSKAEL